MVTRFLFPSFLRGAFQQPKDWLRRDPGTSALYGLPCALDDQSSSCWRQDGELRCSFPLIRFWARLRDSISYVLMFLSGRKVKSFDAHSAHFARAIDSDVRPRSMALAIDRQFFRGFRNYGICWIFDWRIHLCESGQTADLGETVATSM